MVDTTVSDHFRSRRGPKTASSFRDLTKRISATHHKCEKAVHAGLEASAVLLGEESWQRAST